MMKHGYDFEGWYTGPAAADAKRATAIEPPLLYIGAEPGQPRANFSGVTWLVLPYQPPAVVDPLPAIRAEKWEAIKAERDRRTQAGGYKVGAHWFHSDTFSRTQQIGLTIMGGGMPPGLQWKTMDGSFVAMTPTLAQQVFAAAGASDAALFAHAETLRAQVQAAEDPGSVDILAGWPPAFGE